MIPYEDLSEVIPLSLLPALDHPDTMPLSLDQVSWQDDGYLILENFMPADLIDRYVEVRQKMNPGAGGWRETPYMHIAEIRDLCLYRPLTKILKELIGVEMGLHLNLSGWVSTERNWHCDSYLNPPGVFSWYCATWIALDDIHPDSGPYEFVPGSHVWPPMTREKIRIQLEPGERDRPDWPKLAERFTDEAMANKIAHSGIEPQKFIAKKGDVLIWHANLIHRGSPPNVPGMERRALIGHYSAIDKRPDFPKAVQDECGSYYFPIKGPLK